MNPRSILFQHIVNFYRWMLRSSFRADVLQEFELCAFTMGPNPSRSDIHEAQKLLNRRLYQLAKDMGFYRHHQTGWHVRLVGLKEPA
jgi:hypothetical protein